MIAVTGATGVIGSKIAVRLAKRGIEQRLLVRNPERTPALPGAEIGIISAYSDTHAMRKALDGIKTLFLVSARDKMGVIIHSAEKNVPVPDYDRVREHTAAIKAAVDAGVERIVYLSFLNASKNATFILSHDHSHTEETIRSSGLNYTFLRPNLYMDKVPELITGSDVIRAPAGNGRVSWVSRDDIADVAVEVLTSPGHDGKTYDITGPEALTMEETAVCLAAVTGRNITYEPQTPENVRTSRSSSRMAELEEHRRRLAGSGLTDYEVEVWITHYSQIATGEVSIVSDTIPHLCGRPAESLMQFLERMKI